MAFVQASSKQPCAPHQASRAESNILCPAGSRLLNVTPFSAPTNCCHRAFTSPRNVQCSRTMANFPKLTLPLISGSSTVRQAAAVEPYFRRSAPRSISAGGCMSPVNRSDPVESTDVSASSDSVILKPSVRRFGCCSTSLGTLTFSRTAAWLNDRSPFFWPLCLRFLEHSGSRSQIVIKFLPGIGCRNLKSFFGVPLYPNVSQADVSSCSSMLSCGSLQNPLLQAVSKSPY
mmetsp:Transcript_32168/g.73582  ORF Transcript_32168/g.73582 Transcript_32168/m.73582 type:complete len:231 (+) Transcript_32168:985-1677(+)